MKKLLPGLCLSSCIAVMAKTAAIFIPGPGSICLAILFGMIAGNLLPSPRWLDPGLQFAEAVLLPTAIALMGTELELHTLKNLGLHSLLIVTPSMILPILTALIVRRLFSLSTPAALVLGIGNSVCGSSAALASAAAVNAEKHDTAVAVAAVNLTGSIGMFLIPALAFFLKLSQTDTAYLVGGSLQAVGQVAAAGFSVSAAVGEQALVIKMLRVLMIGPIVMILHLFFRRNHSAEGRRKQMVPGYIIGFMTCAGIASVFHSSTQILTHVKALANLLMIIAMAAIGLRIHLRSLLAQGPKAVLLVLLLSVIQTASILLLMHQVP